MRLKRKRLNISFIIIYIVALSVIMYQIIDQKFPDATINNSISLFANRYIDILPLISSDFIGYLGDSKPKDIQSVMAFMLTQYTLAPVVVDQTTAHDYVVGNYYSAPPTAEDLRTLHLIIVKDFNNGVVLYRRVP